MIHHYEVVNANEDHARSVAARMSRPDRDECWAALHWTPEEAAIHGFRGARHCAVGIADRMPFCLFGLTELSPFSPVARPWLLATIDLPDHALPFLRGSRDFVDFARRKYDFLENFVDARHVEAIRWLSWLGFNLDLPAPYGLDKLSFHRFWMET